MRRPPTAPVRAGATAPASGPGKPPDLKSSDFLEYRFNAAACPTTACHCPAADPVTGLPASPHGAWPGGAAGDDPAVRTGRPRPPTGLMLPPLTPQRD